MGAELFGIHGCEQVRVSFKNQYLSSSKKRFVNVNKYLTNRNEGDNTLFVGHYPPRFAGAIDEKH
jgi:hypothetical protein